jgi:hypothetical protein
MAPKATQQDKLYDALMDMVDAFRNPDSKENAGPLLHDVFVWQEIKSIADKNLKAAWSAAQSDEGILPPDDELREEVGQNIPVQTKTYSCIVKVDEARETFDRDAFISSVAAKFKIPAAKLVAVADRSKKPSAAPLSKRVTCAGGRD